MKTKFISLITLLLSVLILGGCTINIDMNDEEKEVLKDTVESVTINSEESVENIKTENETQETEDGDTATKFGKVYTSKELGYKLTVPDEWLDYGYYVEYEYDNGRNGGPLTGAGMPESWEDKYYAYFNDWPSDNGKFLLLVIGSAQTPLFDSTLREYETWAANCEKTHDPLYLPEERCYADEYAGPYYARLGRDIVFHETPTVGKDFGYVFYSYRVWMDAPNKFIEDGQPLPDLDVDFNYTGERSYQ